MHACRQTDRHAYTHMQACMQACIHARTYKYIDAYIHVYTLIHPDIKSYTAINCWNYNNAGTMCDLAHQDLRQYASSVTVITLVLPILAITCTARKWKMSDLARQVQQCRRQPSQSAPCLLWQCVTLSRLCHPLGPPRRGLPCTAVIKISFSQLLQVGNCSRVENQ